MCREDGLRKGLAPFRQACGSGWGLLGFGSDLREKPDPDPTVLLLNKIQIFMDMKNILILCYQYGL